MGLPLADYRTLRPIRESPRSRVYEAISDQDDQVVIAKVFDIEDEADEDRVQHEFELIRRLEIEGVVRALELRRVGDQLVLVLERVPGTNLAEYAAGRAVPLENFWTIATQIADILSHTHAARVIHRDIKPANILIDTRTQKVCLADFGISVLLENERRHIYDSDVVVGTLPYISPEQTGRTRRAVDFRSDLYSLGVTFYELLTGRRPFESAAPLELIHAHLALEPRAPDELRSELPSGLSRLVMKLLAKAPDQRYQTASGLAADLRELRALAEAGADSSSFELGTHDHDRALRQPRGLIGRERELAALERHFQTIVDQGARRTLTISGPVGVGKSALLRGLESSILERAGYLVRGEFRATEVRPYSAFIEALHGLFEQLLTESDSRLERWRRLLIGGLGKLAPVLSSLVPEFELIVGELEPVEELGGAQAHNRLQLTIDRLLAVVCSTGPLVLALENLQYIDPSSLRLLEALVHGRTGPLMIVTTVRAQEVAPEHGLRKLASEIEALDRADFVRIGGLSEQAVRRYLELALPGLVDAAGLAARVTRRTRGVPLFIEQMLPHLVETGALRLEEHGWCWRAELVESAPIPDDAVAMMRLQLDALDAPARTLIRRAATIGERFELEDLKLVTQLERQELGAQLVALENAGLLSRVAGGYGFVHDSVRKAAREGTQEQELARTRWLLGRALLPSIDESDERLFEVVDHLDAGRASVEAFDALELAQLNLRAGSRALAGLDVELSAHYLEQALELVEDRREQVLERGVEAEGYELLFRLVFAQAEQLVLAGEHERAEQRFVELLAWPLADRHYAEVVSRRLQILWGAVRLKDALELGHQALARLGYELPTQLERPRAVRCVLEAWQAVGEATLESIAAMPRCEDERWAGIISIIASLKSPAFALDHDLFLFMIGLHAALCDEHGYHPTLPRALGDLSIGVSGALGRVREAVHLQDLAGELARREPQASETRQLSMSGALTLHRARLFSAVIAQFELGYELALEAGEFDSAGFLGVLGLDMRLEVGTHLRVLDRRCRKTSAVIGRWCTEQMRIGLWTLRGLCHALIRSDQVEGSEPARTPSPALVWGLDPEQVRERGGAPLNYHIALQERALVSLVLGDTAEALRLSEQLTARGEQVMFNTVYWARSCVLACASYYSRQLEGDPGRPELAETARRCHASLQTWAAECPGNYGHYLDFVEGLRHAVRGQGAQALEALDRAWAEARQRGCRWLEGLAAEGLVAQFERLGLRAPVEGVLQRAWDAYAAWGAEAKLERLRRDHPALFRERQMMRRETAAIAAQSETSSATRSLRETGGSIQSTPQLDLSRVLRSVNTMSEELRLEEVIARVLDAALTNVGADHGLLVLEQAGELALVAETQGVGEHQLYADPPLLREAPERLPSSLVHFVARTGKPILLDDASADIRFAGDDYLERTGVRSILAMPLLKGERRLGVLVLENHLSTHGFSSTSLEALRLITSQAASTLENAQLYDELQRSQERWRSLVDGAPDLIALLNERGAVVFRNHEGPLRGIDETHDEDDEGGMLAPRSAERWRDAVELVLEQGVRQELELEFYPRRGESEWYAVRVAPIEIRRGIAEERGPRHRNAVAVATDITARRRAETEMQELEAQLRQQQRLESVGTLASGVAHEINNPIQGIMNYADLIQGNATDRELVEDFASEITHESQRVAKIVRNLLAFSRQDATAVAEPVMLSGVVDASLSLIRSVLRRDNITIELDIEEELPRVMCRAQQVQQVIMNLVTNSRDALNERYGEYHARKRIEISVKRAEREGWQRVGVRDFGPGIPPDVLARIFDPFFTTKGRDQGTGLGLAVSHGIVQDHDSELSVDTELGEGTCFSFELRDYC